jgi:hypothetical protein
MFTNFTQYSLLTHTEFWCPFCKGNLHILSHLSDNQPNFMICWHCQKIQQVGKGYVRSLDYSTLHDTHSEPLRPFNPPPDPLLDPSSKIKK